MRRRSARCGLESNGPMTPDDQTTPSPGPAGVAPTPTPVPGRRGDYWQRTRRLTLLLLLAWLLVTLLAAVLGPLISITVFGWPLGFWFGAQGALLLFLGIVVGYVWWMERIEDEEDGGDDEAGAPPLR